MHVIFENITSGDVIWDNTLIGTVSEKAFFLELRSAPSPLNRYRLIFLMIYQYRNTKKCDEI